MTFKNVMDVCLFSWLNAYARNKCRLRWEFGIVGKTLWSAVSIIGVPGSESWFHIQFHLPANVHPGRQQVIVPVLGSMSTTWETWIEFQALNFSLAWPWMMKAFGDRTSRGKISVFCLFQINKNLLKKKKRFDSLFYVTCICFKFFY